RAVEGEVPAVDLQDAERAGGTEADEARQLDAVLQGFKGRPPREGWCPGRPAGGAGSDDRTQQLGQGIHPTSPLNTVWSAESDPDGAECACRQRVFLSRGRLGSSPERGAGRSRRETELLRGGAWS